MLIHANEVLAPGECGNPGKSRFSSSLDNKNCCVHMIVRED
jgi:hypothetical protein